MPVSIGLNSFRDELAPAASNGSVGEVQPQILFKSAIFDFATPTGRRKTLSVVMLHKISVFGDQFDLKIL